jgi:hypothetical protein
MICPVKLANEMSGLSGTVVAAVDVGRVFDDMRSRYSDLFVVGRDLDI